MGCPRPTAQEPGAKDRRPGSWGKETIVSSHTSLRTWTPNSWVLSSRRACDLVGGMNPERWVLDDLSPSLERPGTRYSDSEVGELRFRCQALGGQGLSFP